MSSSNQTDIRALQALLAELRHEATACPWTREQDFTSLSPQTIEEAYELADAISRNDLTEIKSELGDLLYHIFFYFQLAEEEQLFTLAQVIHHIIEKHERRMPSMEERKALNAEEANDYWQRKKLKQQEKNGILTNIAKNLPALTYADKIQSRAARSGFDWPDVAPVFDKIAEEVEEVKAAMNDDKSVTNVREEIGDLLFTCVNLARKLNISAEEALRQANQKFSQRIQRMEQVAQTAKRSLSDYSLEELDQLWMSAKE